MKTTQLSVKTLAIVIATGAMLTLSSCSARESMPLPQVTASPSASTTTDASADLTENLQYLIEEEKLAHDVYAALYEQWGSRVFGNILQSEASHQSQVLTVMNAHGVEDLRLPEKGKFANEELQAVYDELMSKGALSERDAFEVGVAIEQLDIADLTEMLKSTSDTDAIAMMQVLISGSEKHLSAFNRQLG